MPHKIFLSHNHTDKPIVEPVAIRLAAIFGQDQVFYDSWAIKPGDSIIEQMNKGLQAPELVLFFVTANSLASGMVKLEWQNALYAASKGKTRVVPVRVDGAPMPPILTQTLFIDMHTVGLEAGIAQIVAIAQGGGTFTPQHLGFSNLTFSLQTDAEESVNGIIRASHLMEPNPNFLFGTKKAEEDFFFNLNAGQPYIGGMNIGGISLPDGTKANAFSFRPMGGALTPGHPLRFNIKKKGSAPLQIIGVMHQAGENNWVEIPQNSGPF